MPDAIYEDPRLAALYDVFARSKPGADRVAWRLGDTAALGSDSFDLVTMTGNTVQALLGEAWPRAIGNVGRAISGDGHFVFESRIPASRAWESWTPELTRQRREVPGTGIVETWTEVTDVSEPLVSFRHTYRFPDGSELTSDSTLEFRTLTQLSESLSVGGFEVVSVRDAPDRPGLEYVVVAQPRHAACG